MKETAHSRHSTKEVMRRLGVDRFSSVQLLVVLALLFTCAPFVEEMRGGHLILSALFSMVLLAAVFAVARRKRVLIVAIVLAIPAIAGRWFNHFRQILVPLSVFFVLALFLLAFVLALMLGSILLLQW